jgi:serine/threonine-protein kinase RsbW
MDTHDPSIDLTFPSELGYERIAREAVAAFARRFGFDQEQIENLKTALGEVCINAIEHGNACVPGLRVLVHCEYADDCLRVDVQDRGIKQYLGHSPSARIEQKVFGSAPLRGMGLMLISQLVDHVTFSHSPEGGNICRLTLDRQHIHANGTRE